MKIYVVTYTSYEEIDGGNLYTSSRPYLKEDDAMAAHRDNMVSIAIELFDEDTDINEWLDKHKNYAHIEENIGNDQYMCGIEEFDL